MGFPEFAMVALFSLPAYVVLRTAFTISCLKRKGEWR